MLDILGKRYIFFAISLLLIVPGFVVLAIWGMPLAIDFVGGSMLELQFDSGVTPQPAKVYEIINEMGITDIKVQTTSEGVLVIRTPELTEASKNQIIDKVEALSEDNVTILRSQNVGPTIGKEVTSRAAIAIAVAALGVVLYIGFAFRGIPNAWRYGACAIVATVHDILIIISIASIGSHFWGWQIDSMFLTAMLTVIGFSTQDTIVVFDRIRENNNIHRKLQYEKLVNHSIVQTLQRSINTQLMTSEFLLLSLALFGGVTMREFALVLLIGLASGTYSSIFIAAPVLVVWENKEWKNWFKPKKSVTA